MCRILKAVKTDTYKLNMQKIRGKWHFYHPNKVKKLWQNGFYTGY